MCIVLSFFDDTGKILRDKGLVKEFMKENKYENTGTQTITFSKIIS